jgi:hypothetical protein
MITNIPCDRTKKGYPAVWECGGGYSNRGSCQCIADADGNPKTAVFVRHGGPLACGNHALFIVNEGDLLCRASQWRGDYTIDIYRLTVAGYAGGDAIGGMLIARFSEGEWDDEPPSCALDLIDAAKAKARDYHCRTLYYGKERRDGVA